MSKFYFLKLRNNIELQGDINLAIRELNIFFKEILPVYHINDITDKINIPLQYINRNLRSKPPIGFICSNLKVSIYDLVIRLNFIQEIWGSNFEDDIVKNDWCLEVDSVNKIYCLLPFMAAAEFLSFNLKFNKKYNALTELLKLLTGNINSLNKSFISAVKRKSTSTSHAHGLHKFKAKFFPRLIRSILISKLNTLPKSSTTIILDPFVGSGTLIVESLFLGLKTIGIDIDKLSCKISSAKYNLLNVDLEVLKKEIITFYNLFLDVPKKKSYEFPSWISSKFERWNSNKEKEIYELEISKFKNALSLLKDSKYKDIIEICVSDAISKKFNIRMMGTGSGRFALEISKKDLEEIVKSNLKQMLHSAWVIQILKEKYKMNLGFAEILNANANSMPILNESIHIILTSPPYLPASSGRENYLIGKSISITALDVLSEKEIINMEKKSVGSMNNNLSDDYSDLPTSVYDLFNFLYKDELRKVKAYPILSYYKDLKNALKETFRVLVPEGLAIYIIGKESVFYTLKTREVLYRVKCDDIFSEIATSVGFVVEEKIDVELDKKNTNARPRGLDSYFESIFFLRKTK